VRAKKFLIVGLLLATLCVERPQAQSAMPATDRPQPSFFSPFTDLFVRKPKPPAPPADDQKATLKPAEAAEACVRTAHELAQNGHRREAILLFEKARQLDPKLQLSRYLAVLYDAERQPQALTEYQKALAVSPKDPDLLNDLGYYYYVRGDFVHAEQWMRAAIKHAPLHERAWVNLGMVYGDQKRYQESYDAFAKVLTPAAAHSNVAMILARNGDRPRAEQACRQALALEPDLRQPRALLAYYYRPASPAGRPDPLTAQRATLPPR